MRTHTSTIPTATANASIRSWQKIALRWMPTFLGFPAGGFVAEVVGRIDGVAPAIAGGAITGAILGLAQWLGMRRTGPDPIRWIIATAVGFAIGLGVGASAIGYDTGTRSLATQGAICGVVIGIAQAAVHGDARTLQGTGGEHDEPAAISTRGVAEQILTHDLRGLCSARGNASHEMAEIDGEVVST